MKYLKKLNNLDEYDSNFLELCKDTFSCIFSDKSELQYKKPLKRIAIINSSEVDEILEILKPLKVSKKGELILSKETANVLENGDFCDKLLGWKVYVDKEYYGEVKQEVSSHSYGGSYGYTE